MGEQSNYMNIATADQRAEPKNSIKVYNWSRLGLRTIGALIRATIGYNKANSHSPNSYRQFPNISHQTVRNYAEATIKDPQQNDPNAPALAAIAPKIYKFVGYGHSGELYYDPTQTYSSWMELAEHIGELNTHSIPEETEIVPHVAEDHIQLALPDTIPMAVIDMIAHIVTQRLEQTFSGNKGAKLELSSFLQRWVSDAYDSQLERLKIDRNVEWREQRQQIIDAMVTMAAIEPARAQQIMSGESITRQEMFALSFLFPQPGVQSADGQNIGYDIRTWEEFAAVGEAIAVS